MSFNYNYIILSIYIYITTIYKISIFRDLLDTRVVLVGEYNIIYIYIYICVCGCVCVCVCIILYYIMHMYMHTYIYLYSSIKPYGLCDWMCIYLKHVYKIDYRRLLFKSTISDVAEFTTHIPLNHLMGNVCSSFVWLAIIRLEQTTA